MQRPFILIGFGLLLIVGGWTASRLWLQLEHDQIILVGGTALLVERAETSAEQARGLARRWCRLSDQEGMYFIYSEPVEPSFWMKDMKFAIDLIWIAEGMVVGWETNVQPDKGTRQYLAPAPVDRVLEVRAGWVTRHQVKIGDQVEEGASS